MNPKYKKYLIQMKVTRRDLRINNVKNFIKNGLVTDSTTKFFKDYQIEQEEDRYWRYGILRHYDDLYVAIIPHKKTNKNLREDALDKNLDCSIIVSYMVVHKEWGKKFRFIELIDTFYEKNNLGYLMFDSYMKQYSKSLLPIHIIPTSVIYWKKYLLKYFNIDSKEEYNKFIEENELLKYKNKISWDYLLETL